MTTRPTRSQIPCTPKRPLSQALSAEDITHMPIPASAPRYSGAARSQTPVGGPAVKKYKAAISSESRTRTTSRAKTPSSLDLPSTPTRTALSRSTTPLPGSPRTPKRSQSRCDDIFLENEMSEMDVSRVDPEEALVDAENVEVDLSVELDERELRSLKYGGEDKVLVSVRVRPTTDNLAWTVTSDESSLKLLPQYHKSTGNPPPEYHYDEVLTGSANKPVYNAAARSHVNAAMDGFNAVIFAYGQTASGKTFTLSGNDEEPGIIPRAMKDVFACIRRTPTREYLLRCSYLEIYNEAIFDLLAPPTALAATNTVQIQGVGDNVVLSPLREEVVTGLKSVREVLERGYGNRRTASTDWNERSSRSHSVFRVVIESRERGSSGSSDGRSTPMVPPTPGGTRLQSKGGRSVQTSVLSLIDLAGSERATSDKERTREGRYINTSLLTLGSVIGTLAENAAKGKSDHVPFRNSKLTRMLQPSLSGNARISVICTINPEPSAVAESTSTLLFAQRVKRVQLNAKKKEVVDTDALLQRYRKEIEDLKQRLSEREAEAPVRSRRLSAKEQLDESRAMNDLNSRIRQLTKLILTSQTVGDSKGDESRPGSPSKLDFDLEPYQLQQELLSAHRKVESQATQILSLEAALLARPELPADAPESEKDKLIADQTKTIRELEIVVHGYEENLGEPLRAVKEDVEQEWILKVEQERKIREEKEAWAEELVRQLEKEKGLRQKLEEERAALTAFVTRFDALGLASAPTIPSRLRQPVLSSASLGPTSFTARRRRSFSVGLSVVPEMSSPSHSVEASPVKPDLARSAREAPNLLDAVDGEFADLAEVEDLVDLSFEGAILGKGSGREEKRGRGGDEEILSFGTASPDRPERGKSPGSRSIFHDKENIFPP
ncbi:kinesin-domain-containing protein [Phellopilus nigrolimitatus]|nr:kinesin-domain-containing protein [Phellopilus nigrolimitatus]